MGGISVDVDWAEATLDGGGLTKEEIDGSDIFDLVRGYVDFNGVLKNITGANQLSTHIHGNNID